jgi:hypothetical protein
VPGTPQQLNGRSMYGRSFKSILVTASTEPQKDKRTGNLDRNLMFGSNLKIVGPIIAQVGTMPDEKRTIMFITNPTHGVSEYANILLNNPKIRIVAHAGTDQMRAETLSGPVGGAPVIIGDHSTMMLALRSDGKFLTTVPDQGTTALRNLGGEKTQVSQTVPATVMEMDRIYAGVPANYATPLSAEDANWLGGRLKLSIPTGFVITAPRKSDGSLDRNVIDKVLADPTIHRVNIDTRPLPTDPVERRAEVERRTLRFTNLERVQQSAQFLLNQREYLISTLMPERKLELVRNLRSAISSWQRDDFPLDKGSKPGARLNMRNIVFELELLDKALLRMNSNNLPDPQLQNLITRGKQIIDKF